VLGNPSVGFFGKGNPAQVTQRGDHYMERAELAAVPAVQQACQVVLDEFFTI
jgi:hypothetical protein